MYFSFLNIFVDIYICIYIKKIFVFFLCNLCIPMLAAIKCNCCKYSFPLLDIFVDVYIYIKQIFLFSLCYAMQHNIDRLTLST